MHIYFAGMKGKKYNRVDQLPRMARLLPYSFLLLFSLSVKGQFYPAGQDPFSTRWKQIVAPDCRIIFSAEDSLNAERLANIIEHAHAYVPNSLHENPRKISIIMHNRIVEANGLVVWAPRRMELNTIPPQDIYSQDWLQQLGLHEYRHVVQSDKINHGITRVFSFMAGQQVPGAVMGLVPRWFLEGDAVYSETAFSNAGRGSLPSFEMELRTLELTKGSIYNYDKMLNSSYRSYVPDYYQYGFKMVSFLRNEKGKDIWSDILGYTGRHPYLGTPFTFGLEKYAGYTKERLQKEAFAFYDSIWHIQDRIVVPGHFGQVNIAKKRAYTDYRYPVYIDSHHWVVLKSGVDQLPEFVLLDSTGNEKHLEYPGSLDIVRLSSTAGQLAYAEVEIDPRWDNQSFSVIRKLDLGEDKIVSLTRKSKYFAPSLSPDGSSIAAVEMDTRGNSSLVILNAQNGSKIMSLQAPSSSQFIQPCWIDSSRVAIILLEQNRKSIQVVNLQSLQFTRVLDAGHYEINDLAANRDGIYFRGAFSGIDNIYVYSLHQGETYRITSSRFGAYNPSPSPDGRRLVWCEYSANGFNIAESPLDSLTWTPLGQVTDLFNPIYAKVTGIENGRNWDKDIPAINYGMKPYSRAAHLFNFHSWLPFYYDYQALDINNPSIYPGASLISQNLLGTAYSTLGYKYYQGNNYLHGDFTYKGFYPVFELNADYGGEPLVYPNGTGETPSLKYDRFSSSLISYLPLFFPMNSYYLEIYPFVSLDYKNDYVYGEQNGAYYRGKMYVGNGLIIYHFQRQSTRDLAPRFAQLLRVETLSAPWNRNLYGSSVSGLGEVYLPGILPHHSFKLTAEYEVQQVPLYFLSMQSTLPLGITDILAAKELKILLLNYSFPVCYPDVRLSWLAYLKRIRAGLYYGYAEVGSARFINDSQSLHNGAVQSVGAELLGDFHLLRSFFPFVGGLRYVSADQLLRRNSFYEFVFYADLSNF